LKNETRDGNWHDMPHHSRFVQFSLLDSDGDVHDRLRKQVFKLFTSVMVNKLRDEIQAYVDSLVRWSGDRTRRSTLSRISPPMFRAHYRSHFRGSGC
jgi:cytochrome P450